MKPIFNEEQQKKASFILENSSKLSELYSNEIKDLAVVLEVALFGKIEGNTE